MNLERIEGNIIGDSWRGAVGLVGFNNIPADPQMVSSRDDLWAGDVDNDGFGDLESTLSASFRVDRTYSGWLRPLRDELV